MTGYQHAILTEVAPLQSRSAVSRHCYVRNAVRAPENAIIAPPFPRKLRWFNVATLRIEQQRGRPVLVEFWDFCRINSLRTLPYVKAWHERYADAGLRVIGVHTGAFACSRDDACRWYY